MPSKSSVIKPFGDIAFYLSGGGYRAAAYALGTLSMLNELDLFDDVKLLSTISDGTFTGLTYTVWQSEGKTFDEFKYGRDYATDRSLVIKERVRLVTRVLSCTINL